MELAGQRGQPFGVIQGGRRVMDRARPRDHQQPVVDAGQHRTDLSPGLLDVLGFARAERQFRQQRRGRQQGLVAQHPDIAGMGHYASPPGTQLCIQLTTIMVEGVGRACRGVPGTRVSGAGDGWSRRMSASDDARLAGLSERTGQRAP